MKKKLIFSIMFLALLVPLISAENCLAETYVDDTVDIPSGYMYTVSFTVNEDSTELTVSINVKSGPSVLVFLSGHISSTVSGSKDFDVNLDSGNHVLSVTNFGSGTATVTIKISSGFSYWGVVIAVAVIIVGLIIWRISKSKKQKAQLGQPLAASRSDSIYGSDSSPTSEYSSGQPGSQPSTPSASGTLFCHGCGTEISGSTKFCKSCGTEQ